MKRHVTGIIWVGPVYDRGGYGNVSRNYLIGLAKSKLPVKVIPFGDRHAEMDPDTKQLISGLETTDVGSLPVLVVHSTPEMFPEVRSLGVVKRIGCTIFETHGIPKHWVDLCNQMDSIWVPTQFNFDTFSSSGVEADKLSVVPYAIDTRIFSKLPERPKGAKPLVFLYVFSFGWRKGFDLLLEAFLKEFKKGEAKLILRSYTEGYQGVTAADQKEVLFGSVADKVDLNNPNLPEVEINDKALTVDELIKLYENSDVYISTDRANGWGVPCMEAMALGRPTATIDWSGSTQFMNEKNSLLIHPSEGLEPVDARLSKAVPQLYEGQKWAKVNVTEVRRVMRWAYAHPEKLAEIAKAGQEDMALHYNTDIIAQQIISEVNKITPTLWQFLGAKTVKPYVFIGSIRVELRRRVAQLLRFGTS